MPIGTTCAYIINRMGIDEGFTLLKTVGFDCVDFSFFDWLPYEAVTAGRTDGFFGKPDEELRRAFRPYKEAAEKNELRIWQAHAPFPTLVRDGATTEAVRASLRKCVMLCGFFGCRYLVIHPAFLDYDDKLPAETEWNENIAMYSALIPDLQRYGVTACLENIYTRHGRDLYDGVCCEMSVACRYIDALNERAGERRFGFCLDTGHALLTRNDVYAAVTELGDRLAALHIHDNDGIADLHQAPYAGRMDWDRFLRALRDNGYGGCISFEADGPLASFGEAVAKEYLQLLCGIGRWFDRRLTAGETPTGR